MHLGDGNRCDRRTFLKRLALAGGVPVLLDGCARASSAGRRVVVLGAGLAGLAAAWNLVEAGYDVIVLEAQDVPGGRVKTLREPFTNGGYADVGAVRIPSTHQWTMKYVRLMGLESKLRAYDDDDAGEHLWYLQGRRFVTPKGPWPLDGLTPQEKTDPFGMIGKYWSPAFEAVGDPTRPDFPTPAALPLDAYRLGDYFKAQGASDAWIQLLLASEANFARVNMLAVTALEAPTHGQPARIYGLVGGNDQLPKAIAASLGTRVKYRSPVVRLAHDDAGVTVTTRDAIGQHEVRADHCVCALPFPLLRDVAIAPAFSDGKMTAIDKSQLLAAARLCVQTKTRFWQQDPLGRLGGLNMVGTDTVAERLWNTSHLQPDPTLGMLQSYMFDDHAAAFARIRAADRSHAWLAIMARALPRLPEEVVASASKVWQEDPWQRGAVAFLQPDELEPFWPATRRSEGRVHFAGEHTSIWFGYQNGALESAERCVSEILAADRGSLRTRSSESRVA